MASSETRSVPVRSGPAREVPLLLQQGSFDDFDHLNEATRGWDLDARQLGRGPLRAELFQAGGPAASVTRVTLNREFEQQGAAPPGARTFGVIEEGVAGVRWCGRPLTDRAVTSFPEGGHYRAISGPSFAGYGIALSEERIAEVAETLEDPRVDRSVTTGGTQATTCEPGAIRDLRDALRRVGEVLIEGAPRGTGPGLHDEIESEIPVLLLTALASGSGGERPPSFGARELAIRRALPYIESQRENPISLADLCRVTRLSRRTLQHAFKEHFGVTPKAFLTAVRLNGVRRGLVPADSPVKIAEVANRWGFWHLGQFAADYRKQFGELPSETLRRRGGGRGPAAPTGS